MQLKESTRALIKEMTPEERQRTQEIIDKHFPRAAIIAEQRALVRRLLNPEGLAEKQILGAEGISSE